MTAKTKAIDLAGHVRDIASYAKKEIKALAGAFVETVALEDLPVVVLNASKYAAAAKAVQDAGEVRLVQQAGWKHGRAWTDARVGGEAYEFRGAPGDYEILDPDGLHAAFAKASVPQDRLNRALFKVWKWDNDELNALAKAKPDRPRAGAREALAT